ncbi:hypothetical protein [Roseibium alexandrii]|uniref:hypothetical protein n=1 Tax=Roseibium alexandrii TaxID=388408 RepID=UPI003752D37B
MIRLEFTADSSHELASSIVAFVAAMKVATTSAVVVSSSVLDEADAAHTLAEVTPGNVQASSDKAATYSSTRMETAETAPTAEPTPEEPTTTEAETFKRRSFWCNKETGELQKVEPGEAIPDRSVWDKITGEEYTAKIAQEAGLANKTESTAASSPEQTEARAPSTATADEIVENSEKNEPKLTMEETRAWVVENYLNAHFEEQADRTAAFRSLMEHFGVAKFKELSDTQLPEVKAHVETLIAGKKA